MRVHRCKASYWTSNNLPHCSYEVLVDGVRYLCNERELDCLYDGIDPVDLELEEVAEDPVEEGRGAHYLRLVP